MGKTDIQLLLASSHKRIVTPYGHRAHGEGAYSETDRVSPSLPRAFHERLTGYASHNINTLPQKEPRATRVSISQNVMCMPIYSIALKVFQMIPLPCSVSTCINSPANQFSKLLFPRT